MFKVVLVGLVVLVSNISMASVVEVDISNQCKVKWDTKYSMVNYCIKREIEAYNKVVAYKSTIKDSLPQQKILNFCSNDNTEWTMLNYCIERQNKALFKAIKIIKGDKTVESYKIIERCMEEWVEWTMVMYCHDKEIKAFNLLNGKQ